MHYKNGREAKNGDQVIGQASWIGAPLLVGMLIDIQPGQESCNATLLRPGGMVQTCVSVGDFYHAEDALLAIKPKMDVRIVQTAPPPAAAASEPGPVKSEQAEPEPASPQPWESQNHPRLPEIEIE